MQAPSSQHEVTLRGTLTYATAVRARSAGKTLIDVVSVKDDALEAHWSAQETFAFVVELLPKLLRAAEKAREGAWLLCVGPVRVVVRAGGVVFEAPEACPAGAYARLGSLAFHGGTHVSVVAYSPDKSLVALGFSRYEPYAERSELQLRGNASISIPTEHPLSALLPSCAVRVFRVADGTEFVRLQGHTNTVRGVCFFPDGRTIVTGARDRQLRWWNVNDGLLTHKVVNAHKKSVKALAISPDGKLLASAAEEEEIAIRAAQTGEVLQRTKVDGSTVDLEFSSPTLLHIFSWKVGHLNAHTFDTVTETLRASEQPRPKSISQDALVPEGPVRAISALAFRSNEELAATSWGGRLCLWNCKNRENPVLLRTTECRNWHHREGNCTLAPNGSWLATVNYSTLTLYDVESGALVHEWKDAIASSLPLVMAFSMDGSRLVATNGYVNPSNWGNVWDSAKGTLHAQNVAHYPTTAVAFSRDGKQLATYWEEKGVLFTAPTGENRRVWYGGIPRVRWLSWAEEDSKLYAITLDYEFHAFDLAKPLSGERFPFENVRGCEHRSFGGPGPRAALSPDESTIAAVDREGLLGLWNVKTGERKKFSRWGHERAVTAIAWSPDGSVLATGGEEGTVVLWKI